ncbi:4Fe-4S dicluster domain-containing protein [Pseudodesulfovibrio cashew]|uniref:4Fe-4S dicluster domain-containing protein n=1 Tax=Pseudodesulfovibrio cashew TaxID=2678688 RepID=A0A6I6JMM7_9BACT|nr:4Fe-4S binding protein [Pseudodesulfovibrio cashew]QGY41512.1 4Fe-4S dicluster domain-containing protein [Pseudodesulfovibrio cashew]
MHLRNLKSLRVAIAAAFLVLTSLLFLDFREMGAKTLADSVLFLQFVPSLLNFLEGATFGAAGFLAVLAITLLFGRIYCSAVCPFGILQDAISRMAGGKRHKYANTKPHNKLRYAILGLTILLFLTGSGLMLNMLDPFSSFGRVLSNLVRPLLLAANNMAVPIFEQMGSHALYRVQWAALAPVSIGVALTMLLTAGWLSARHGRLYCNTLCPVGTLLGLFSKAALFRVRFNHEACRECGRCERACKASCIDFKKQTVDASRCVSCYNCLTACPNNTLQLSPTPKFGARTAEEGSGRRKFLIGLAAGSMGMAATKVNAAPPPDFKQSRPTTVPEKRTSPISPPGSRSIEQFTSRCTACHLCVSACPSRVLVPSFLDYGLSGMMQPQMSLQSAHCNFDCTICSNICPSGAILPLAKEQKQITQVGVAHFLKENCVVYTDNTNCGACSEHCPTKAVHMVPYLNAAGRKLVIPEVTEAICVGCGGCEHACPTRPFKAIFVDGNPVHKVAEKPILRKLEPAPDANEDFPF